VELLGQQKPLVGVVHLLALPGAPGFAGSMDRVIQRALADATAYLKCGIEALIVENYGDAPYLADALPPETIAAMAVVVREVRSLGAVPLGVNALRSDGLGALAIAQASGAQFIRVNVLAGAVLTDQGVIQGCAARLLRLRRAIQADVAIWADLRVKHASPLAARDPLDEAHDLRHRALADALIVTGSRTGAEVDRAFLRACREALPEAPWVVGSGVAAANLASLWELADGFIVGTSLKCEGRTDAPVDPERVRHLVRMHGELSRRPKTRRRRA